MPKTMILGCASTGAKFTPNNHRKTGDSLLDNISTGAAIKTSPQAISAEAEALYGLGCRYYHYHARNPVTHEQTTDNDVYQQVSRAVQRRCPEMLLSFGGSRNGKEVRENISKFGEWERISQSALPLHLGGAHFVTMQAAVELQMICEIERRYGEQQTMDTSHDGFSRIISSYVASNEQVQASLDTYSTSKGSDYGRTSPSIQFEVYKNAIDARRRLGLFHEIEWVQFQRSKAMTRFAIEHPSMRLGSSGQLNITLLFGFSPRLPFPDNFDQFKRVVDAAKAMEFDIGRPGDKKRNVTISVGAALLPQHAEQHFKEMDVGPNRGIKKCALRRLIGYASQPGSQVDILRFGMEDTPYLMSPEGELQLADNVDLATMAREEMVANGVEIETNADRIFEVMGSKIMKDDLLSLLQSQPLGKPILAGPK